jgi:hypothetical protein
MLQSITIDSRRSNLSTDLTAIGREQRAATAQGDFAHGQRRDIGRGRAHGDFATGMRTTRAPGATGDFATGTHTSPRRTAIGDFATGLRTASAPAITNAPTAAESALAVAA